MPKTSQPQINKNKKRVLLEFMNTLREKAGQPKIKTIRGFNKVFGEKNSEKTYKLLDALKNVPRVEVSSMRENTSHTISLGVVKDLYKNNMDKNVRIVYKIDNDIIVDDTVDIPKFSSDIDFDEWWNTKKIWTWRKDTDSTIFSETGYQGEVLVFPVNGVVNLEKILQAYLDGKQHCVFTPMRKWAEDFLNKCDTTIIAQKKYKTFLNKLNVYEKQYKDGLPEEKINEVCEHLNVRIVINMLFDSQYQCVYGKNLKNPRTTFTYTNTRYNHLDINSINEDNVIQVSADELCCIQEELDEAGEFYYYTKRNSVPISGIYSNRGCYCVLTDFDKAVNEFKQKNGFYNIALNDFTDREVSRFIYNGTHYNCNARMNEYHFLPYLKQENTQVCADIKCIDQKKAYYNFRNCKYYEGFVGKVIDFRKCDKIMGIGYYLITDLKPNKKSKLYELDTYLRIFQNNNIYTTPELKYLDDNGYKYKIIAGAYGFEPFHFDFGEEMLSKINKKPYVDEDGEFKMRGSSYYSILTGAFDAHSEYAYRYVKGDEKDALTIQQHTQNKVSYCDYDDEIRIAIKRTNSYHWGHITGFILAYQRLGLLEQLEKMDINQLCGIYVDGIYYINHEFEILDTFQEKEVDVSCLSFDEYSFICRLNCYEGITRFTNGKGKKLIYYKSLNEKRDLYKTEVWTGAGGCGKTHINLTDKGMVRVAYSAISHKLNSVKAKEFNVPVFTWEALVCDNVKLTNAIRKYNTLIIDEVSMMSNEYKTKIMERYSDMRLIFCGDIGYQLPAIEGTKFDISDIQFHKHLTENRRVKQGDKLLNILNEARNCIETYTYPFYLLQNITRVNMDYVKENYTNNDMILSWSRKGCDKYTEMFPHLKKWYIEKGNQFHNTGEIFIQEDCPIGGILKHAFTVHSIQGETCEGILYLDKNIQMACDFKLFYTALSRAREVSQIKWVEY